MNWQDQLTALDARLAAGHLSATQYRHLRDELLAQASSNTSGLSGVGATQQQPSSPFLRQAPHPPQPYQNQPYPNQPQQVPPDNRGEPLHGEAVFAATKRKGGPGRALAVIAAIALIGAAVWMLVLYLDKPADTASDAGSTTGTELGVDILPNPTETPLSTTGVLTIDQARQVNLIGADEAKYLAENQTSRIAVRGVAAGDLSYQLFAYQTPDGPKLASSIIDRGKAVGMTGVTIDGVDGVTVTKSANGSIYEAAYGGDRIAVRIVIVQAGPIDDQRLRSAITHAILQTLEKIPVTH